MSPRTLRTLAVRPSGTDLAELIREQAAHHGVGERALRLQALLHLPRLADEEGYVTAGPAADELCRCASRMVDSIRGVADWAAEPDPRPAEPSELCVSRADESVAQLLLERFHYLR
ncbi:MAG: hypothetical protein QOG42_1914, partial [Solirubrobacteraceae bacterium]|nr:hypothetical protein [Solirubrobacteraceae bacterium]